MDSGKARSHRDGGVLPVFQRKTGISEYLLRKYSDSPRPSATPLINAGGKHEPFSIRSKDLLHFAAGPFAVCRSGGLTDGV